MTRARSHTPVPWSADADATLRQMWAAGDVIAVIAKALGRTEDAIMARRKILGLPSRARLVWTDAEIEELRQLVADGFGKKAIAKQMRRDRETIVKRLAELGLVTNPRLIAPNKLPDAEVAKLQELAAQNIPGTRIAAILGIPHGTVVSRCHAYNIQLKGRRSDSGAPNRRRKVRSGPTSCPPRAIRPTPAPMPPVPPNITPTVSIADAEMRHCRYPAADFVDIDTPIFCGAPAVQGRSYCAGHLALCTTVPKWGINSAAGDSAGGGRREHAAPVGSPPAGS